MSNADLGFVETSEISDEVLARRVQEGNIEQFGLLVERYQAKILRYAKKFLMYHNNIEDVVQDVFLKTYQNIKSFDPEQKFSPWLYRIAHNSFINEIRKNSRQPISFLDPDTLVSYETHVDPEPTEDELLEMAKLLETSLDELSPKYKEIIILYYYEELSYKEIAEVLHIPISTVGVRLQRAKEALKLLSKKAGLEYYE